MPITKEVDRKVYYGEIVALRIIDFTFLHPPPLKSLFLSRSSPYFSHIPQPRYLNHPLPRTISMITVQVQTFFRYNLSLPATFVQPLFYVARGCSVERSIPTEVLGESIFPDIKNWKQVCSFRQIILPRDQIKATLVIQTYHRHCMCTKQKHFALLQIDTCTLNCYEYCFAFVR